MKSVAVFCGSNAGANDIYKQEAVCLGRQLAERGLALVYGGTNIGIMGIVADAVLEAGGEAVGVITKQLQSRGIQHPGLTKSIIVDTMHERKATMMSLAGGFVALPGGPGTMEEFFEVFTWAQLGLHDKPCGLMNVNHYYDGLIEFFVHMNRERFLRDEHVPLLLHDADPHELLDKMERYVPPTVKKYGN